MKTRVKANAFVKGCLLANSCPFADAKREAVFFKTVETYGCRLLNIYPNQKEICTIDDMKNCSILELIKR